MDQVKVHLLALLSSALNQTPVSTDITTSEWNDIFRLAKDHAVLPLAYAGASAIRDQIPDDLLMEWRGSMVSTIMQNERLMNMQDKILEWMKELKVSCAILKGSSHSVYYPKAEMRPLGDIDLLVSPLDMENISSFLIQKGFRAPETDHPFHIDFYGYGVVLEVHYAVSDFPDSKGGHTAEQIMTACLDDVKPAILDSHEFPVLSVSHQALNQLLHMERHMTTSSIGLRQLCDWAAFILSVPTDELKEKVLPLLQACGMTQFAKVLTRICVCYLGLDSRHADWCMDIKHSLADVMLDEIFRAGNMNHASEEDDMSSVLVGRYGRGNRLVSILKTLNNSARRQFPIAKKCPLVLPFFWLYIPIQYWIRSKKGQRPSKSIGKSLSNAQKRNRLYQELNLYHPEK